jgi:hypothetical protein
MKNDNFFGLSSESKYNNLKDFRRKMFLELPSTYIYEKKFCIKKKNKYEIRVHMTNNGSSFGPETATTTIHHTDVLGTGIHYIHLGRL